MVEVIDQEGRSRRYFTGFDCEICNQEFVGQWTDFHGQATCRNCGAPYQLKSFSGAPPDMRFPRIDFNEEFKPIFKEYWDVTGNRCRLGKYMGYRDYPGIPDERRSLIDWLQINHPEWVSDDS